MVKRMWYGFPFHNLQEDLEIRLSPRLDVARPTMPWKSSADLPGLEKKDISISLEDDLLTIKGERKEEKRQTVSYDRATQWHFLPCPETAGRGRE